MLFAADAGDAGNFNLSGAFQTGVLRCGNLIEFHNLWYYSEEDLILT